MRGWYIGETGRCSMKTVALKSQGNNDIDSLFRQPIETLCSYTAVDFAEHSAAAMLPDELRALYLKQCELYRPIENEIAQDYLLHLTVLVFIYRKCAQAEKIINQFICDPDFHVRQPRTKNPVWQKCVKMHAAIKKLGLLQSVKEKSARIKRDSDYVNMLSLCRKKSHSNIVISEELEKTFHFNRKENPEQYERLRKRFLRFRKKYRENSFKNLPWPSDDFYFFADILKWCFVEIDPGFYILEDIGDSDVNVNTFLLKAFNVADQIPQRKSTRARVDKIFAEYTRLTQKFEQCIHDKNRAEKIKLRPKIKELETSLIKYNESSVIHDPVTAYSKAEQQKLNITLRGAIIGRTEEAKAMQWKANGFTELPIELSPRGKFIQTREHLTGNGFKCIPAGSILTNIQLELYVPQSEGMSDNDTLLFLKRISKSAKLCDSPYSRMGRFMLFDIPVTLKNFSELMQKADLFPVNASFTITFKGRMKKTVFLKWDKDFPPPQPPAATKAKGPDNGDKRKNQKPKLSGKQKMDCLLASVASPGILEELMTEYNFTREDYQCWIDTLFKKANTIFEEPGEEKGSEDKPIPEP